MPGDGNVRLKDALREAEEVGWETRPGKGSEIVLSHFLERKTFTIRGNRRTAPKILLIRIRQVRRKFRRLRRMLGFHR